MVITLVEGGHQPYYLMEVAQRMYPEEDQPWRVEELAWTGEVVRLAEEEVRLVEEVVHLESVELLPELMVA
jgi:hypothetical protein